MKYETKNNAKAKEEKMEIIDSTLQNDFRGNVKKEEKLTAPYDGLYKKRGSLYQISRSKKRRTKEGTGIFCDEKGRENWKPA